MFSFLRYERFKPGFNYSTETGVPEKGLVVSIAHFQLVKYGRYMKLDVSGNEWRTAKRAYSDVKSEISAV